MRRAKTARVSPRPIKRMKTVFLPKIEIDPKKEDIELLKLGIDENNILVTGESTGNQDITFFIRNSEHKIVGGIRGTYNISGWHYLNALWADKNYRNQGYATLLMQRIENEAKEKGCTHSYLNTKVGCCFPFWAP